jgi:hypothetical protein
MFGVTGTYIFCPKLIGTQVNGTEGAATNFILDDVLIYPMMGSAVSFIVHKLNTGVKSFL